MLGGVCWAIALLSAGSAGRPAGSSINGVVHGAEGDLVPGAAVFLHREEALAIDGPAPPDAIDRATTDRGGAFTFRHLREGVYRLTAVAPGRVSAVGRVLHVDEQSVVEDVLVMGADGAKLSGQVKDVKGRPVDRAVVRLTDWGGMGSPRPYPTYETVSDGRGRFSIVVPLGGYTVDVDGRGAGRAYSMTLHLASDQRRTITVHPPQPIQVRVLDEHDGPVGNATLWLGSYLSERRRVLYVAEGRTGTDGTFRFDSAPLGDHFLVARRCGLIGDCRDLLTVDGGQEMRLACKLKPGHRISGRVVDEHQHRLAGVRIVASRSGAPFYRTDTAITADDGSFEIDGLLPGSVRLIAEADGFAPSVGFVGVSRDGASSMAELRMVRCIRIEGHVSTPDGLSTTDAEVFAHVSENSVGREHEFRTMTRTDKAGRFLMSIPSIGSLTLTVRHESGLASLLVADIASMKSPTIELKVERPARITGTILYDDGLPAAGSRVEALPLDTTAKPWSFGVGIADCNGRYVIETSVPGGVRLAAVRKGDLVLSGNAGARHQTTVQVPAHGETSAPALYVRGGGNTVQARVLDHEGKPLPGALVAATEDATAGTGGGVLATAAVKTDRDGWAFMEDLPEGRYTIWATYRDLGRTPLVHTAIGRGSRPAVLRYPKSAISPPQLAGEARPER
jgi:hypothetical protein